MFSEMATLPPPDVITADSSDDGVLTLATRLVRLEMELARTEVQGMLLGAALAVGVAVAAALTLMAGFVLMLAALLAPLFGAPWEHLALAGGLAVLAAAVALAACVWRLRRIGWPRLTLTSLDETLQWLEAQMKSRMTLS
jgi:uncharacterized membrane protein YqjE